jgi:ADP-ribosylglycohydrolase
LSGDRLVDGWDRASASLHGLAVGDALGSQWFVPDNHDKLRDRRLPPGPWAWTDDTEMACSVFTVLATHGRADQDELAAAFADHHDVDRGYGPSANRLLRLIREGGAWRSLASDVFEGRGSWGNGAAMRVAPLGAWYGEALDEACEEAARSAAVTHAHPEGMAGAVAVAAAAGLAAAGTVLSAQDFLDEVVMRTPEGLVHRGMVRARGLTKVTSIGTIVRELGNGSRTSAHDTVPIALWAAARHLDDFESAVWTVSSAGGDVDTTAAITGGVVAARTGAEGIPAAWRDATEPLPAWVPTRRPSG